MNNKNVTIWVFSYAPLENISAALSFAYRTKFFSLIKGYKRQFHQAQINETNKNFSIWFIFLLQPGLSVTVVPTGDTNDAVYGLAYEVVGRRDVDICMRELSMFERQSKNIEFYPNDKKYSPMLCLTACDMTGESTLGESINSKVGLKILICIL